MDNEASIGVVGGIEHTLFAYLVGMVLVYDIGLPNGLILRLALHICTSMRRFFTITSLGMTTDLLLASSLLTRSNYNPSKLRKRGSFLDH